MAVEGGKDLKLVTANEVKVATDDNNATNVTPRLIYATERQNCGG